MKEKIMGVFKSVDALDADGFCSFLTEDAVFVFANSPAVAGKAAIKEVVGGFFGAVGGMKHSNLESFEDGNTVIVKGDVTYTRKDDSTLTVPFCNVFKLENGLIKEYLIYVDNHELFG